MAFVHSAGWRLAIGMLVAAVAGCGSSTGPSNGSSDGSPDASSDVSPGPSTQEQRSSVARDTTPDISVEDYARFIAGTNQFGLDLFHAVVPSATNLVYSPVSTAVALGMTYAGARGNTATQMAATFHSDLPAATFHAGMNQLLLDLASRNVAPHSTMEGTKSLSLLPANAAWVQTGYELESAYLDTLSADYGAGIKLLDFVSDPDGSTTTINQWVAQQTADKIVDLIPAGAITPLTRLVLTNALYFYGSWANLFLQQLTGDGTFHTLGGSDVTVPMMHGGGYFPYAEGDGYQMVELAYDGGQLSMDVVLPATGRFAEIRDGLSGAWFDQVHSSLSSVNDVVLTLPKFKFTWGSASLTEPLKSLGMTDAFNASAADFSGMEPNRELFISDVVHQAFIAIDEKGTEAAAATAVVMSGSAAPTSVKEFTADRPFLIFIRDASGALLFIGQVGDPSA
jgi:serpin B